MFGIKARIARERAIAKICNADTGHFGRKIRVHDLIRGSFIMVFNLRIFASFAADKYFYSAFSAPLRENKPLHL
jgi:hypothetical protein